MKWNLRMTAAQRDIWRPTELLAAFKKVGFEPSLSKVAQLWGKKPISLRLDELDKICAALDCTVAELLQAEPLPTAGRRVPSGLLVTADTAPWPLGRPDLAAAELTPGIGELPCPDLSSSVSAATATAGASWRSGSTARLVSTG